MFAGVNIIAVLGTTLFMLASATIWFSSLLFGKVWLRALQATEAEIEASRENVVLHLIVTGFAYAVALLVLAYVVLHLDTIPLTLSQAAVGLAGFAVALLGATTLWEGKSRMYFLVNAGFYAYFVIVGMYVISFWPW